MQYVMQMKMTKNSPAEECKCGHMLKSHKTKMRWLPNQSRYNVRLKCRYCKCNMLVRVGVGANV